MVFRFLAFHGAGFKNHYCRASFERCQTLYCLVYFWVMKPDTLSVNQLLAANTDHYLEMLTEENQLDVQHKKLTTVIF
jgi:hypothetical protein